MPLRPFARLAPALAAALALSHAASAAPASRAFVEAEGIRPGMDVEAFRALARARGFSLRGTDALLLSAEERDWAGRDQVAVELARADRPGGLVAVLCGGRVAQVNEPGPGSLPGFLAAAAEAQAAGGPVQAPGRVASTVAVPERSYGAMELAWDAPDGTTAYILNLFSTGDRIATRRRWTLRRTGCPGE